MVERLLLKAARIWRAGADPDLPAIADLLIAEGRILAIGASHALAGQAQGASEIDLSGHLLLPGFINAHYHSHDVLAKGAFESQPLEQWGLVAGPLAAHRSLDEVRLRTLIGAVECLRNGITTVQDFCAFAPQDDRTLDTILAAYEEAGIRVIFGITLRDRSQLATIPWADELVPPRLRAAVGDKADDAAGQLAFVERQIDRIGTRGGRIIWALCPSAPQRCSPALLQGVAALAQRRSLPVYTHVYESRAQRIFAAQSYPAQGGSLLRYMEELGLLGPHVTIAHGVWPDPAEIAMMARSGTGVVLNMLSNLRLRNGVAPIAAYRRLGIPLALGCDNCSCSDVQSMFQVMKLYCLLGGIGDPGSAAPSAAEALRLATLGGARSAGMAASLGAIEVGHEADLVALDLADPAYRPLNSAARQLVYAETGRAIRHAWIGGRQVLRDGRTTLVDEDALLDQLTAVMPSVAREIDRLRDSAVKLGDIFTEIQRRAWAQKLGYDRFLERS